MFLWLFLLCLFSSLFGNQHVTGKDFLKKGAEGFRSQLPLNVNPVTGEYSEEECDLVVAGVQPLSYRRLYAHLNKSEIATGYWKINPETHMLFNFCDLGRGNECIQVGEKGGSAYLYDKFNHKKCLLENSKSFTHQSFTGQDHPLNTLISYERKGMDYVFQYCGEICTGDGRKRRFSTERKAWPQYATDPYVLQRMLPPSAYQAQIDEEILPNGNVILYEYESYNNIDTVKPSYLVLKKITALDSTRSRELGHIRIEYDRAGPKHLNSARKITVTGSDGRRVIYSHFFAEIVEKNKSRNHPFVFDILLNKVEAPGKPEQSYGYGWKAPKKYKDYVEKVEYYQKHNHLESTTTRDGIPIQIAYDDKQRVFQLRAQVGEDDKFYPIATYHYFQDHTNVIDAEGNQTTYFFDEQKRITKTETPETIEKNSWDSHGNLKRTEICNKEGKVLTFKAYEYDAHHNAIKEIFPDHTIFRRFENNRLVEEIDGDKRTTFAYDRSLLIEECIYEKGRVRKRTKNRYDSAASLIQTVIEGEQEGKIIDITPKKDLPCIGLPHIVEEKDLQGNLFKKTVYSYNPAGNITEEKHFDANNQLRYRITNQYENEQLIATTNALGHTTSFTYDAKNNLTSTTKANKTTQVLYDKANRPIQIIDGELITKRSYDKLGRLVSETNPQKQTTSYTYDAMSRVIAIHNPDGSRITKEYDPLGNVIAEMDGNGYTTRKRYNHRNQPIAIEYPDLSQEHFTYDVHGNILTHVDKNGATTHFTYDIFNNVTSTCTCDKKTSATYSAFHILSQTDAQGMTTTYHYNSFGQKVAEKRAGRLITYGYDALGNCTEIQKGDTLYVTAYDLLGRVIEKKILENHLLKQESYRYDEAGNQIEAITSKGSFKTAYNRHNQPLLKEDPLGNKIHFTYQNGLLISETNPLGVLTAYAYDACNRLTNITKKDAKGTLQSLQKSYDANGNCIEEEHHLYKEYAYLKSITHSYTYGPLNRLERSLEAGQKETRYYYDRGRLVSTIKPNNTVLKRDYDAFGRLIRYYSHDFDYCYSYDKNDNLLSVRDEVTNQMTERRYNAHGEITAEILGNGLLLHNRYNAKGERIELILPDQSSIFYSYIGDKLHTIKRNNLTHSYTYDLDGDLIASCLPNQEVVTFIRDPLSRLRSIQSPYFSADYAYDANGNLIQYNDQHYTYDSLDQLLSEKDYTYTYDSLHNRHSKNDETFTFNDLNQITAYQYDANGNLIADGFWRFSYDSQDRLIESQSEHFRVTYSYDAFHRRLSKSVYIGSRLANEELYICDGQEEIGINGKELKVQGNGTILLELEETYIPIHDHSGNIICQIDSSGNCTTYEYSAFGESASPWGFLDKRRDPETKLVYFGRRYYSPALGRWLTPDPAHEAPNLYTYTHNNPFKYFDQRGLWSNPFTTNKHLLGFMRTTLKPAFQTLEFTGKHLVPIGGVRDVIESIGRWGAGGEFFEDAHHRKNYNRVHTIEGKKAENQLLVYLNGIGTTFKQAILQAKKLSQAYGGVEVTLLYNGTHGFVMDLIECVMAKLRIPTPYERMCTDYFTSQSAENPDTKFTAIMHSQGATHGLNAARACKRDVTERMTVHAFGPASFVPRGLFAEAYNYVSCLDAVSATNLPKYASIKMDKRYDVKFLSPNSYNPLTEHFLMSDTYFNEIKDIGRDFQREHLPK